MMQKPPPIIDISWTDLDDVEREIIEQALFSFTDLDILITLSSTDMPLSVEKLSHFTGRTCQVLVEAAHRLVAQNLLIASEIEGMTLTLTPKQPYRSAILSLVARSTAWPFRARLIAWIIRQQEGMTRSSSSKAS